MGTYGFLDFLGKDGKREESCRRRQPNYGGLELSHALLSIYQTSADQTTAAKAGKKEVVGQLPACVVDHSVEYTKLKDDANTEPWFTFYVLQSRSQQKLVITCERG